MTNSKCSIQAAYDQRFQVTYHVRTLMRPYRSLLKATFHLTISMRGERATGKIQKSEGYFSLNDFYAWGACNGQNSKE